MTDTAQEQKGTATTTEQSGFDDLASILTSINKIAARLEAQPEFSEAGIFVSDWLLLNALQTHHTASVGDLARQIGVTRKRLNQQALALEQAGFTVVLKAEGGDTKMRLLSLTAEGLNLTKRINDQMLDILSAYSGADHGLPLKNANKALKRVVKLLLPPKSAQAG